MAEIACPHCGVSNTAGGSFCAACGKALPEAVSSSPRIVSGEAMASTAVGQSVQADQLRKQCSSASVALIAVSILSALGGVLFFILLRRQGEVPQNMAGIVLAVNLVLAAIYAALGIWARSNPLPAAIVGLVLFLSVHAVGAVADPASIPQGIVVKIIIIVVLIRAIQAGLKYRSLKAHMAGESGPAAA